MEASSAGAGEAQGPGGHGVAAIVQAGHGDLEAFALFADAMAGRNPHIVAVHPAGVAGPHAQLAVDAARWSRPACRA